MERKNYMSEANVTSKGTLWEPEEGHEVEENEFDPDEGNQRRCDVCTLPIFSTPYQTEEEEEEEDSHRFLHKCCANLPQTLTSHPLHPRQPLYLHDLPDDSSDVICNKCTRECKGFIYRCPGFRCRFTLDILCATTVKIVHRSHKHELTLIRRRRNCFTCAACGLEHEGEFYWCDVCGFYLHCDCALLPNAILHKKHGDVDAQQHPLSLTFVLPENAFTFKKCNVCSICNESLLSPRSGIYFCTKCDYAIHVKCAMSDPDNFHSVSSGQVANSLIHLPMIDNEHLHLIQYLLENKVEQSGDKKNVLIEKIHDHELIFYENYDNDNESLQPFHICNACVFPISPPFYTCTQCSDFHLHKYCANLPRQYHQHSMHYQFGQETCRDRPLELLPRLSDNFFNVFTCSGCNKHGNGFVYGCKDCSVILDVTCTMLPEAIIYEKHSKSHILLLSFYPDYHGICHLCKMSIKWELYYECCSCPNFKQHTYCALLPLTISHKYDRHLLKLTSSEFLTPKGDDEVFCEICEVDMMRNPRWFYQCQECVTLFHIGCMPFIGGLSAYTCGETVRVQCHDCPLKSVYLITSYSYTCGLCKGTIQGKQFGDDVIAFECTKCAYWLHRYCAKKQWVGN